jgi:hypothetical protein
MISRHTCQIKEHLLAGAPRMVKLALRRLRARVKKVGSSVAGLFQSFEAQGSPTFLPR